MGLLSVVLPGRRRDPLWDLEGSGVRRRRQIRRVQALLAWIDLGAVLVLGLIGPPPFHLPTPF